MRLIKKCASNKKNIYSFIFFAQKIVQKFMQKVITQPVISIEYKSQIWKGSFRESKTLQKNGHKIKNFIFSSAEVLE